MPALNGVAIAIARARIRIELIMNDASEHVHVYSASRELEGGRVINKLDELEPKCDELQTDACKINLPLKTHNYVLNMF